MESWEVGRSKLCLEPLKLARLAGAPGSLLEQMVEPCPEAENAMMQDRRPTTLQRGSPGGRALVLAAATVSTNQQVRAAP